MMDDKNGNIRSDENARNDDKYTKDQEKKQPLRYNLYSGLKGRVSVRIMDIIIYSIIVLLIIILFIGIFGK